MMVRLGSIILLLGLIGATYSVVIQSTSFQSGGNQNSGQKCLTGSQCTNSNSLSMINNQVFCCPNGGAISSSASMVNGVSFIDCRCSSGAASTANFDWDTWNKGWDTFHNNMFQMNRQLGNMGQQMSNMFSGNFPFNNNGKKRR